MAASTIYVNINAHYEQMKPRQLFIFGGFVHLET